ncbi:uncharacterized protein KY384_003874 [Bacidia gigantensis]|uniref:uncharacterized protein n=1 Tax=Bacidia gigantensis TaxID=2732470 RepID=UPI001D047EF9|nr:uncharacterized protein KY384_003874 [Bacidia gigantensis]KAG8532233.1 hypothetical protein KY384_003874 [Bacidia gigantensis]
MALSVYDESSLDRAFTEAQNENQKINEHRLTLERYWREKDSEAQWQRVDCHDYLKNCTDHGMTPSDEHLYAFRCLENFERYIRPNKLQGATHYQHKVVLQWRDGETSSHEWQIPIPRPSTASHQDDASEGLARPEVKNETTIANSEDVMESIETDIIDPMLEQAEIFSYRGPYLEPWRSGSSEQTQRHQGAGAEGVIQQDDAA